MSANTIAVTRRAFDTMLQRAWFLLALVPWRASAQICEDSCPSTYIPCRSPCSGGGYFLPGCNGGPQSAHYDGLCGWCPGNQCAYCAQNTYVWYSYCFGSKNTSMWDCCVTTDPCCVVF